MKVRNIVFPIIVCLFLCGPLLTYSLSHVDARVSSWIKMEDASALEGNYKNASLVTCSSLDDFLSGSFQDAVQSKVNRFIPFRSTALLGNSAVQRLAIECSSTLFSWECYPTYFGSSTLCVPSDARLSATPTRSSMLELDRLKESAECINAFSDRAEIPVFVYLVPDSGCIEEMPASSLVSDSLQYADYAELLQNASNLRWIEGDVSLADFQDGWFKTDHHWNALGSYNAYLRIASALGADQALEVNDWITFDRPWFYGSLARSGLCVKYHDTITDCLLDYPDYEIEFNEASVALEEVVGLSDYEEGLWSSNPYANRYAEYFHNDYAAIKIENKACREDRSLLLVGDSYTNNIERLLAFSYSTVYVIDPRHYSGSIGEFIDAHPDIDQVLLLAGRGVMFGELPRLLAS